MWRKGCCKIDRLLGTGPERKVQDADSGRSGSGKVHVRAVHCYFKCFVDLQLKLNVENDDKKNSLFFVCSIL